MLDAHELLLQVPACPETINSQTIVNSATCQHVLQPSHTSLLCDGSVPFGAMEDDFANANANLKTVSTESKTLILALAGNVYLSGSVSNCSYGVA